MTGRQACDHRFMSQRALAQLPDRRRVVRETYRRDAVLDELDDVGQRSDLVPGVRPRNTIPQPAQERGDEASGETLGGGGHDIAFIAGRDAAHPRGSPGGSGQQEPGILQQRTTCCGDGNRPVPHQQGDLQVALELADRLTERGLGHPQPLRGAREARILRHRHEIPEAAQIFEFAHCRLRAQRTSAINRKAGRLRPAVAR